MDNTTSNELEHYGVLGMKWGVHKARSEARSYLRKASKAQSEDEKRDWEDKASRKLDEVDLLKADIKEIQADRRTKRARVLVTGAIAAIGVVAIAKLKSDNGPTAKVLDKTSQKSKDKPRTAWDAYLEDQMKSDIADKATGYNKRVNNLLTAPSGSSSQKSKDASTDVLSVIAEITRQKNTGRNAIRKFFGKGN